MYARQKTWSFKDGIFFKGIMIPRLVQQGQLLETLCTVLLEGNEGETERTYMGFGTGWTLTNSLSATKEPLEDLRVYMKEFNQQLHFSSSDTLQENCTLESGIFGYIDYEWGLLWQRPSKTAAHPNYFFRICPVNIIFLPQTLKIVLEVFGEEQQETSRQFQVWESALNILFNNQISGSQHFEKDTPEPLPIGERNTWESNMSKATFLAGVEQIKEFIRSGEVFQAVFSQKFTRRISLSPWQIYQRLRVANPSPYLFWVKGNAETLVGSSPELLLSSVGSKISTRPIAGTRPRGRTEDEDKTLEEELLKDIKENAEHSMLVDLGRNDIGRVAAYGSVRVPQYGEIKRYSQVMHLVSTVEGELRTPHDGLSALQAVFPAGTLSGAPKVRAMEILQELEREKRGSYGGALGIVRWNGDVDFCITIRTLRVTDYEVSVQAGAGIVYDSVPEREYEETLHKARALMKVVDECADND
jgi:Anthranilate/para-aminobenzoate synthases component I